MAPAAPFNPPAPDLAGKPHVPAWNIPPVTQQKEDFIDLTSIDLSHLDSEDPAVVEKLVQDTKRAIREDGFLLLENYGVSLEQVRSCTQLPFGAQQYKARECMILTVTPLAPPPIRTGTVPVQQHVR